jgi:hypothetical protein
VKSVLKTGESSTLKNLVFLFSINIPVFFDSIEVNLEGFVKYIAPNDQFYSRQGLFLRIAAQY